MRVLVLTLTLACANSSSHPPEPVAISTQGGEQPGPTASAAADVPEVPSREVIARTLRPLHVRVAACVTSPGPRDQVRVAVEIVSDGSVRDVQLSPNFAGTSEGNCIADVVRSAYFGPFQRATYRVQFPYRVRVPLCQRRVRQAPLDISVPTGGEWILDRAQADSHPRS